MIYFLEVGYISRDHDLGKYTQFMGNETRYSRSIWSYLYNINLCFMPAINIYTCVFVKRTRNHYCCRMSRVCQCFLFLFIRVSFIVIIFISIGELKFPRWNIWFSTYLSLYFMTCSFMLTDNLRN